MEETRERSRLYRTPAIVLRRRDFGEADRLINDERAEVIFGCWTSASRKSVLPVVEAADHLLVYPMAYEGLETSPQVIYTGAAPNQQITPAVQWCHTTLAARRFFLIGSDYIWPHCVNAIISDQLAYGFSFFCFNHYRLGMLMAVFPAFDNIKSGQADSCQKQNLGQRKMGFESAKAQ